MFYQNCGSIIFIPSPHYQTFEEEEELGDVTRLQAVKDACWWTSLHTSGIEPPEEYHVSGENERKEISDKQPVKHEKRINRRSFEEKKKQRLRRKSKLCFFYFLFVLQRVLTSPALVMIYCDSNFPSQSFECELESDWDSHEYQISPMSILIGSHPIFESSVVITPKLLPQILFGNIQIPGIFSLWAVWLIKTMTICS